jgi:MMP 1-O-methyltransferase
MGRAHAVGQRVERWIQVCPPVARLAYRARYGPFGPCLADTSSIPSWLTRQEGLALAAASYALPPHSIVVEIGSFLGTSAIWLAAARKRRGSGTVHCIDPFDASGDAFSAPIYHAIANHETRTLRQRFDTNIARAGLTQWVNVHQGTAVSVASHWTEAIDMLFLDGDQSPAGVMHTYTAWSRFLKVRGILALHNSNERDYAPDHDGHYRLARHVAETGEYGDLRCVDSITFARKIA